MREQSKKRLRQSLLACASVALVSLSAVTAYAADDEDEDTFEQKIIKNILGGLGVKTGGSGIEYRERSPLVLPPSRDLPPPAANTAASNPAWPRDPERRKKVVKVPANVRAGAEDPGSSAAMTPDELRRGTVAKGGRPTDYGSQEDPNIGRPLRPNELNTTGNSIFSWSNLTGRQQEETAPFTGEPGRSTLTQPPTGYQTPSPAQPYGVASERSGGWKIPTLLDRPVGSNER